MRVRLIYVCRAFEKYLNKNVETIRDGNAREDESWGSKRRCVVKICTTHGIRQIADNSANRGRGSSSEPVTYVFAQDENIRRALSLMCAKSDPIHNIDNDKYAEINFILRNSFSSAHNETSQKNSFSDNRKLWQVSVEEEEDESWPLNVSAKFYQPKKNWL